MAEQTGLRPQVLYRSREPDGPTESIPCAGDATRFERFYVSAIYNDIICRQCMVRFCVDPAAPGTDATSHTARGQCPERSYAACRSPVSERAADGAAVRW